MAFGRYTEIIHATKICLYDIMFPKRCNDQEISGAFPACTLRNLSRLKTAAPSATCPSVRSVHLRIHVNVYNQMYFGYMYRSGESGATKSDCQRT